METVHTEFEKVYTVDKVVPKNKPLYSAIKRLFDIVVSFVAAVIMIVPMLVIAVCIKLDSKGPAIFKQERLGKDGKPFIIWKFRSMTIDAEKHGPQWADINDNRVTKVGRFLRNTRLDELPQLWNIFKGDMSFVGPRPERACFYEEFELYIHGFSNRMAVVPGLTGLAQVNGGYELLPEEKIVFDMEYIAERTLWLDCKCIFKTIKLVFTHKGAR